MIRIGEPRDIGETLALLRQLARISQRDLVALSGISQTEISLYETGDRVPRPAKLLRYLAAIGWGLAIVPLDEIGPQETPGSTESAEQASGVDGSRDGDPNGATGLSGGAA